MNSLTARWVYCAGLFFVTACAVLPEAMVPAAPAVVVAKAPPTVEQQLAHVMRERIEFKRSYGSQHPESVRVAAIEKTLRQNALAANPDHFHRDLLRALTNELSDALASRTAASLKYDAKHPEYQKAELAVAGLMTTINVEMRQRDA